MMAMACAFGVMLIGAAAGWGQAYYSASGSTAVFTLSPGAKSGPDAIRRDLAVHSGIGSPVTIASVKGFLFVSSSSQRHGLGDIALYNIAGKQVFRQHWLGAASFRCDTRRFAPGMYTVVVRVDGQNYSRRFAVSR